MNILKWYRVISGDCSIICIVRAYNKENAYKMANKELKESDTFWGIDRANLNGGDNFEFDDSFVYEIKLTNKEQVISYIDAYTF